MILDTQRTDISIWSLPTFPTYLSHPLLPNHLFTSICWSFPHPFSSRSWLLLIFEFSAQVTTLSEALPEPESWLSILPTSSLFIWAYLNVNSLQLQDRVSPREQSPWLLMSAQVAIRVCRAKPVRGRCPSGQWQTIPPVFWEMQLPSTNQILVQ